MSYNDPVVAGSVLVREAIKSPDYVPGVSGWSINKDGSAEFNNATFRGTVFVKDGNGNYVKISVGTVGNAQIEFGTVLSGQNYNFDSSISSDTDGNTPPQRAYLDIAGPVVSTTPFGELWQFHQLMWSGYGNNSVITQQAYTDYYFSRDATGPPQTITFLHISPTSCYFVGNTDAIDPTTVTSADTVVEEIWKTATLINGMAAGNGAGQRGNFYYKMLSDGCIALDGGAHSTTTVNNGTVIANLIPAVYCPPANQRKMTTCWVAVSGFSPAMLFLDNAGQITYYGPNLPANTDMYLGGQFSPSR